MRLCLGCRQRPSSRAALGLTLTHGRVNSVHSRSDKIEEAQKELHNPEDLPKGILETGGKTALDIVKGLKRKKIVTDSHLKKISKSPSRNRTQEKLGDKTEDSKTSNFSSVALKSPESQYYSPTHNGKQYSKHNGGVCSTATLDSLKSGTSMQTKKDLLHYPFPELGHGEQEGLFSGDKVTLPEDTSVSTISSAKTTTETLSSINYSTSSTCTSTALDVLLKAMEPELNTLTQKINHCGAHAEKLRSNKTYSLFSSSVKTVQNKDSTSQLETCPRIHPYSCAAHIVQLSASGKNAEAPVQSPSHSLCQQQQSVSQIDHRLQRLSSCPNSRSVETVKLKQMYSLPASSSVGHSVPQALPQHQVIANSSQPISISSASSSQFTLSSTYNLAQVTSLVNQGGEQMCALILKDHKAKKQGKYICEYCNRACAKPSVLLKHIRSHTGERPYPCVTCGFSFKTKSNLYKHKKSHAHAIKLGLKPDSASFSQESDKSLCIHSDLDESGESDDECTSEERQDDQHFVQLEPTQAVKMTADTELHTTSHIQISHHDHMTEEHLSLEKNSEASVSAALPQVVVYPVNVSSSRMNSPKPNESNPECVGAPRQVEFIPANVKSGFAHMPSLKEAVLKKGELLQSLEKHVCNAITSHAQLQRQQATECSQDQQGKCLLSPRSLGSTDSGYFSRSESADQAISSPSPFVRVLPICETDTIRNLVSVSRTNPSVASVVHMVCSEKPLNIFGTMKPPVGPKTLEERISKLISDNEAVVDDKQLDSVKPRRTSLSRRGSIDSPKSYIFKDSFQFDLKPVGRRTSSGSEFPKSPFTPNEKSKQVFFLSVPSQFPSLDCLPLTRSNSMPTTGGSVAPAPVIPPTHPLRGSQSFDDKIGSLCDDVFVSAPTTPSHHVGHPRTLVRQTAVEDSMNDNQGLSPARSVDEGSGCNVSIEAGLPRSKSFAQGSSLDRLKKPHQVRGTMFECETCRNRYRKLENFENHKKFYCSELHGPKTKPAVRETEQNVAPNSASSQMLHYRVAVSTGILEQPPQIRKRRKVKSVGDDDEPSQNESGAPAEEKECLQSQNVPGHCAGSAKNNVVIASQYGSIPLPSPQVQLICRGTEESVEQRLSPIPETVHSGSQERVELKRQGSGISVIQHTNSLSRPSSFEKSESFERTSPVSFQDTNRTSFLSNVEVILVDENSNQSLTNPDLLMSSTMDGQEEQESQSVDTSERSTLVPQLRLVRQHNIQVPEILVTEEPDRDPENGKNDQESEKFNWPQRSESLSNVPTEKLPPKKKRIRLAELEHSSGESSFDSTLSRSLSRESSLSRASSFSASFEKEDMSKAESTSKLEALNKSSEYLMLPTSVNVLGLPREMRRAASEQITCTQSSMEVPDYRSKSFDCGSMSPLSSVSPLETQTPKFSCTSATGHVPLLERRRGPFVRQISLNISPEHSMPQVTSTCLLQKVPISSAVPFDKSQTQAVLPDSSSYLPLYIKSLIELHTLVKHCSSSSLPAVEPQLYSSCRNKHTQFPAHHSTLISNDKTKEEEKQNANTLPSQASETEGCFAPKYQLQVLRQHEKPTYHSEHSLDTSCLKAYSDSHSIGHNSISVKEPSTLLTSMPSSYSVPQQKMSGSSGSTMQQRSRFVVPVHDYSNLSPYVCSASVKLPEILVTQDQVNQPTAENLASMPSTKTNIFMPKSFEDSPSNLPSYNSSSEDNASEIGGQRLTGSLNFFVKVPVCGLLPQQEGNASSKRMLSPANSLDIAMEKNQKRVKDESGAAFTTEARSAHLLTMRGGEQNRPKKHVLVRQVCTTEPLDTLDQEVVPQYRIGKESSGSLHGPLLNKHPSDVSTPQVSESLKESSGFASAKCSQASCSPARNSPERSSANSETQLLNSPSNNQEQRLRVVTCQGKTVTVQGQVKLATSLSMINAGDMHRLSFPSLKTSTSFTWCYLLKRKPLHLQQNDLKISAYSAWTVNPKNPNPLGFPTKVALSLLNSKQKEEQCLYTQPVTSRPRCDLLVYSSKWKNRKNKQKLANHKITGNECCDAENSEPHSENEKDGYLIKHEPRRVKIFDGGYKSNEEYVYVRGRGRGKYICEECGIRCKKPSMLKKHIRTHTDVRPYHCNHCNFSFKTKGNLTKHMKSKAHSKKCIEMGVPDDQYDDQDGDESGDRNRFGCDRPGFDGEDSDGAEEDDNENDDEDEDSQAESTLSTTPSVTTSPQHHPFRNSQHETSSADEELRVPDCLSRADSMDVLPKALLTKMTARSTGPENKANGLPMDAHQHETSVYEAAHNTDSARTLEHARKSLCHQMSIDSTDAEGSEATAAVPTSTAVTKGASSVKLPSSPVDRGTQTTMMAPFIAFTEYDLGPQEAQTSQQQNTAFAATETHLFSHLPLHSQQPARAPYSMVPVGGIQLVPAGLAAYSAFLPIQAGSMQITFPAVGVLKRSANTPGDQSSETAGPTNSLGFTELNSVLPCIPIGQVHVPGLPKLSTPLPSLSMETLNILGIANSNLAPPIHPSGLTLNALGLQVLTPSPSVQSNPGAQTHIPGLQIVNIALPTLIPSVSPRTSDGQGLPEPSALSSTVSDGHQERKCPGFPVADSRQFIRAGSPPLLPTVQEESDKKLPEPATEYNKQNTEEKCATEQTDMVRPAQPSRDITSALCKTASASGSFQKGHCEALSLSPACQTLPSDTQTHRRVGLARRQNTVQYSDDSSDDDEDRLVIAT